MAIRVCGRCGKWFDDAPGFCEHCRAGFMEYLRPALLMLALIAGVWLVTRIQQ